MNKKHLSTEKELKFIIFTSISTSDIMTERVGNGIPTFNESVYNIRGEQSVSNLRISYDGCIYGFDYDETYVCFNGIGVNTNCICSYCRFSFY
jgi:hypothetical protein